MSDFDAADVTPIVDGRLVVPGPPWLPVTSLDSVDSTNAELRRDPHLWRAVVAEEQTEGRGRLGRGWVTTPGTSLAVSVLVPRPRGSGLGWVPLAAGVALAEALAECSTLTFALKWPNDVLAPTDDDRKLAGILAELGPDGVIIGTGINISQTRTELPTDTATSLALAGSPPCEREIVLTAYLQRLALVLSGLDDNPSAVHAAYRRLCATVGRTVTVTLPDSTLRGEATGVDDDGRLLVRTTDGAYAVAAGDVVHVR